MNEERPAGRIVFDARLSLDITSISLRNQKITLSAYGKVTAIPAESVPYAIYGEDESLVMVGRCDFDDLMSAHRLRKGDFISLRLDLDVDMMGVLRDRRKDDKQS